MRQKYEDRPKAPAEQVIVKGSGARPASVNFSAEDKIRHRAGGPARRGQHRRALPPRGNCPEPVLPPVKRLSRAGKKGGLAGDAAGEATLDEVEDLPYPHFLDPPRKPSAQKSHDRGRGDEA